MTPNVLAILRQIDDEQRPTYVRELVWIVVVEQATEESWRIGQTMPPKTEELYVPAYVGHITKLENHGVVVRTYDANSQTRYRLDVPHADVIEAVENYEQYLDDTHEELLESVDREFGMLDETEW